MIGRTLCGLELLLSLSATFDAPACLEYSEQSAVVQSQLDPIAEMSVRTLDVRSRRRLCCRAVHLSEMQSVLIAGLELGPKQASCGRFHQTRDRIHSGGHRPGGFGGEPADR